MIDHYEATNGAFLVSTNRALLDTGLIHHYLSEQSY